MKKNIYGIIISYLLIWSVLSVPSAFAQTVNQTNSTIQDFKTLQQRNANSGPLSYAVFYITENNTCSDSEYKSLKFYQVVADEYLTLYNISHDLAGSLCIPVKNYQTYFSGLSTFTLPIVISDNTVGQQLVQQGFYGMYEITGTGKQAIYICSCDPQIESWAGAWILSHELSHFVLRYFGEPDTIAVNWVHYIQALENDCQKGNFTKVCTQYSASVTSPSGNQIPVMIIYGEDPSSTLPQNAPQSEISATLEQNTKSSNPQNPSGCQQNQICVLLGDYVKYQINTPDLNQTVKFDFQNKSYASSISVKTTVLQNGQSETEFDKLDLIKSLLIRPDGTISNFIYVLPTPLQYNSAYHKETVTFNNLQREIITGLTGNQTSSIFVQIDEKTGILMQLVISHVIKTNEKSTTQQISYKLLDTNKINSSNSQTSSLISIPTWIKNNAKWWSQGSITDSDFTKGIQYMIQNGIMKIPQTQSGSVTSQQIPSWIKNNAGWWANGQISDDEFVKGIQWLVSNGIVKV